MPELPSQILAKRHAERDAFLDKLSNRTRTLCLGTVVLIWGIFTEKDDKLGIVLSHSSRVALVCIAFSAIVVLTLEFAEYVCGFQYRRRLAGEKVWWGLKFNKWETRMRYARIGLGAITLAALCGVLLWILSPLVFADERPTYPYTGTWCGHDIFTCFHESGTTSNAEAKIAFNNDDGWLDCGPIDGQSAIFEDSGGGLVAECRNRDNKTDVTIRVYGSQQDDEVMVVLQFRVDGIFRDPETRYLVKQP